MPELFTPRWHIGDTLFRQERRYSTGIVRRQDGSEQRFCNRLRPRERVSFLARTLEARDTGLLDRILYGGQAAQFYVPFWPHMVLTTAPVSPGSNVVISCGPTAGRRFVDQAILYRDPQHAERVALTAVGGSSVTAATVAGSWPAGTLLIPAVTGRLAEDFELSRLTRDAADFRVSFELELGPDPAVATPGSAQVFTVAPVNGRERSGDRWTRSVERLDSPTFESRDYAIGPFPVRSWTPQLWLEGPSAAAALIAWFDGLKGSQTAFWMPSWQGDLDLVTGGGNQLVIRDIGYTEGYFPRPSRKHLALLLAGADRSPTTLNVVHRLVTASVDQGDGTELLTLDGVWGNPVMVSFMLYTRIAADTLAIDWETPEIAEATLELQELAAEVLA